ncbi:MAG: thioesterase family protein [Actinomycetota bacterium]
MTGTFADATSSRRVALVDGVGHYDTSIREGWDIGGNANGGYLLALAGRAMADTAGRPPLSLTAHYLKPGPAGPCTIDTQTVRAGRRLATVTATVSVGDTPIMQLLGSFGEQTPGGPALVTATPPMLPSYDASAIPPLPTEGPLPEMMQRIAMRLHPDDVGFRTGQPSGTAKMDGWFALADEEPIDAYGLLLASDAFPPVVFNTELPVAWVPTIELTVHIRGVPAPGPVAASFRSEFIDDGLFSEDGELWDASGQLVAQCRQLALLPRG